VAGLVLGSEFITDVALFALQVDEPLNLLPGVYSTNVALRTVCEALTMAACDLLALEPGELRAEHRPALNQEGAAGREVELFIYDTLPGGAGFSRRVGELGTRLLERALARLANCPEGCDSSCYRCLRSFRNRFEHQLLDRDVGAALLRYALDGQLPTLSAARVERSIGALHADLARQHPELTLSRDATLDLVGVGRVVAPIHVVAPDGRQLAVCAARPLTRDVPLDPTLFEAMEFQAEVEIVPIDEMKIRHNLPAATIEVLNRLPGVV
jgi:hypothetical protein